MFNRDICEQTRGGREREERKLKMKTYVPEARLFVDVPLPLLLIYMWGIIVKNSTCACKWTASAI